MGSWMTNDAKPFRDPSDAKRYLLEYSLIVGLLAFGLGSIPTSRLGAVVGTIASVVGASAADRIMARRGRLLPAKAPRFAKRASDLDEVRAMQALRLRYYRSALEAIGVSPNFVILFVALIVSLGCTGFLVFSLG